MLTMELALERAIQAERQGAAFYKMVAKMTEDSDARAFLLEMAQEESQHAETLVAMARGEQAAEIDWSRILAISEPEADKTPVVGLTSESQDDKGQAPEAAADEEPEMNLREAVELALEAEKHAAYTYACMGAETEGEVQELFTNLALTEQRHAELLEGLLAKLDD